MIREAAPPYARWAAAPLGEAIELVPPSDGIDRALVAYLEQTERAQAETSRTEAAVGLRGRMLDLSYEAPEQRISEAREGTRRGIGRALAGVQGVTLVSIGLAALAIGLRSS
jgi:hypothetical protein